jgi:hypothetical protein
MTVSWMREHLSWSHAAHVPDVAVAHGAGGLFGGLVIGFSGGNSGCIRRPSVRIVEHSREGAMTLQSLPELSVPHVSRITLQV